MPLYNAFSQVSSEETLRTVAELLETIESNTAVLGDDQSSVTTAIAELRTALETASSESATRDDATNTHLDTVTTRLDTLITNLSDDESGVRAELVAARDAITAALATHEAARAADADAAQARLDVLATEATLDLARTDHNTRLETVQDLLDALSGKVRDDAEPAVSLAAALEAVRGNTDGLEGLLTTISGLDFSSEATLDAFRDAFVARDLASVASVTDLRDVLAALLTTLRDNQFRRTDPLSAGTNNIGFTSPGLSQQVGFGRVNLASTGRVSLTVAGNLRVLFVNPSGSGKNLQVVRIAGMTTGVGWLSIYLNPTTGLPTTTPRPVMNAVAGGGVAPVAQLRVDTNATTPLGGGIDTGITLGMPSNSRIGIDLPPIILAPGVSLGINVPFTGAADASMSIYWVEA